MARATTLVLVAALAVLLASASVTRAVRPEPTSEAANKVSPDEKGAAEDHECEGAGDQLEECMARRTLAAHTDYIYTQEHHN